MIYLRNKSRRNFSRYPRLRNWEKPSVSGSRSEAVEQQHVVDWMATHLPTILRSSNPAGVELDPGTANRLMCTGYVAGLPDLLIFQQRRGKAGLFIEMKREVGYKKNPIQEEFVRRLNEEGYSAHICKGFNAAVRILEWYFEGEVVYGEFEKAQE